MSTGTWYRLAVGAACVGAALAAPAGALALSTHKATDTTPDSSGQLVATAQCGKGEHVVSGGFKGAAGSAAVASHALGTDSWQVKYPAGTGTRLTVYAYCSDKGGISTHHKQAMGVAPPPNTTVAARCAPDQTVVSGGFEFSSHPLSRQNGSTTYKNYAASTRTWKVTGAFEGVPATLTAFAYCEGGVVVKVRSRSSAPIASGGDGSVTASCHKGETLLAGGYSTTPKPDWDNTNGPDLFFNASYRSRVRSWDVRAHNYSNVAGRAVVFVYCKA